MLICMTKRVFNIRLTHFQHLDNQSLGFISDINRILTKYALHHGLDWRRTEVRAYYGMGIYFS